MLRTFTGVAAALRDEAERRGYRVTTEEDPAAPGARDAVILHVTNGRSAAALTIPGRLIRKHGISHPYLAQCFTDLTRQFKR